MALTGFISLVPIVVGRDDAVPKTMASLLSVFMKGLESIATGLPLAVKIMHHGFLLGIFYTMTFLKPK